jgi:hypothetical protein
MEAICSSEMLVTIYQTTRHQASEHSILQIHHRENFKSHSFLRMSVSETYSTRRWRNRGCRTRRSADLPLGFTDTRYLKLQDTKGKKLVSLLSRNRRTHQREPSCWAGGSHNVEGYWQSPLLPTVPFVKRNFPKAQCYDWGHVPCRPKKRERQ